MSESEQYDSQYNDTLKESYLEEKESQPSNVFGNALQMWTEIDLPTVQRKLDLEGIQLKQDQKSLLLSRKNLAAKTKEFKRLTDEEKMSEFKALLKLYQNEIDTLTNKNKQSEGYFFDVYRIFAEAPDPLPLLELSLHSVMELSEVQILRDQIVEMQDSLTKKADYHQLKQRLLNAEQKSAELISSRIALKEDEFKLLIDEMTANWDKKETQLLKQVSDARKAIEELRTNYEVAQLKLSTQNFREGYQDELNAAAIAELDMALRDAESYKIRILDLERRNEDLRRELSRMHGESKLEEYKDEFTKRILELEGENALLAANLNQARRKIDGQNTSHKGTVDSVRRENTLLSTEVQRLKSRLRETSDYAEIKQELQFLHQIEFGDEREQVENQSDDSENGNSKGLDLILVERNKQLSQELTGYRAKHEALTATIESLKAQVQSNQLDMLVMQDLNGRLESDLASLQELATNSGNRLGDNISMVSGLNKFTRSSMAVPRRQSISQSLLMTFTSSNLDEASILPIITKQRDRFLERNTELEEELKRQNGVVCELKRLIATMKRDNDELYERTRFMASFKNNKSDSFAGTGHWQSPSSRTLHPKTNTSTLDLENNGYRKNYEMRLNPIEQFRAREQERIKSKLTLWERIFLAFTRAILATSTTRMLFMAYCLGLHLIVISVSMYVMSLNISMIPEVGLGSSTGGRATGSIGYGAAKP